MGGLTQFLRDDSGFITVGVSLTGAPVNKSVAGSSSDDLQLETGDYLLLETGDYLLLE